MDRTSWELQDPAVSGLTIMPGLRVLKFELLHHHSLLWSNLLRMGAPVLGNNIQSAPLFPLTLLFFWLPETLFWNVFVLTKLFLIGVGCFLIGSRFLKFSTAGCMLFTVWFGFAVFPMRWLNHPWHNGFCATLWYLYFLLDLLDTSAGAFSLRKIGSILGLALAAYSMATCGFPECAAMGGIMALGILGPVLLSDWRKGKVSLTSFLLRSGVAHLIGLAFASPQIFAIHEYLSLAPKAFRAGVGLTQFPNFNFLLDMVLRLTDEPPPLPFVYYFNLIPLFLIVFGLTTGKRMGKMGIAALVPGLFFLLKCFPISAPLNRWISSLPVLEGSRFTIYFIPWLMWPCAYFAARGADHLIGRRSRFFFGIVCAGVTTLLLLGAAIWHVSTAQGDYIWRALEIFSGFLGFALLFELSFRKREMSRRLLALGMIAFALWEAFFSMPRLFPPHQGQIGKELDRKSISVLDFRDRSSTGDFISAGLATVDNGATAIVPDRFGVLFNALFKSPYAGYLPIEGAKLPDSWRLVAGALQVVSGNLVRDEKSLSRAYVASRCIPAQNAEEAARIVGNPTRFQLGAAIVEGVSTPDEEFCQTYASLAKNIPIDSDQGTQVTLSSLSGPAVVVLSDTYYPGWQAIDRNSRKTLQIFPANIGFKALFLPEPRNYSVEFIYRPRWMNLSLLLMLLAGSGVMAMSSYLFFKRPRTQAVQVSDL